MKQPKYHLFKVLNDDVSVAAQTPKINDFEN